MWYLMGMSCNCDGVVLTGVAEPRQGRQDHRWCVWCACVESCQTAGEPSQTMLYYFHKDKNYKWLDGYPASLGIPNAPSPCHMHPVHNCHHIKSCHPPVKQCNVITTHHNTEFTIYYTRSPFLVVIPTSQGQGPHCGLFCALYTVYRPVSSSGYLPWNFPPSLAPLFPPSLPPSSLAPSIAHLPRSVPPLSSSLHPYVVLSLPRSFPFRQPPCLPSSTPARSFRHINPSLPLFPPTLPLLPLAHPPSFLAPSLPPPCLPASRRPTQCKSCVCVFGKLHWVLCRV